MDAYQAGYQAGVADHGEHHRCARCYAAGQAELQARVAALTAALARLVKTYDGLFANSPTGNAALFESALAEARAALDAGAG